MKQVRCFLCPNQCQLSHNQKGYCQVRQNINGRLVLTTHHQYSSLALDPIEKKPLYHVDPGTSILSLGSIGCNLRCHHCQNWAISEPHRCNIWPQTERMSPEHILSVAQSYPTRWIAFTYNEPLIQFETLLEVIPVLHAAGYQVALVTNGVINPDPLDQLAPLVDAWSIDLKAFSAQDYKHLTGRDVYETVKDNIAFLVNAKRHVEVVTNLVTGINDNLEHIEAGAKWLFALNPLVAWHLSTFRPLLDMASSPPIPLEFVAAAVKVAQQVGLPFVYSALTPDTHCPSCKALLVKRNGFCVTDNHVPANRQCPACQTLLSFLFNDGKTAS